MGSCEWDVMFYLMHTCSIRKYKSSVRVIIRELKIEGKVGGKVSKHEIGDKPSKPVA